MPIAVMIGWKLLTGFWGATLLPLVKAVPWQVWVAVGMFCGVLYYGHYSKKVGYAQCEMSYKEAAVREQARQRSVADAQIKQAQEEAYQSAVKAEKMQGELDAIKNEAAKLKNAQQVCLPGSITDRFIKSGRVRK